MRIDPQAGGLIATDDDYHIERDTLHVNDIGDLRAFRWLTKDGTLFCAAINKHEDVDKQQAAANVVSLAAKNHELGEEFAPESEAPTNGAKAA